MPARTAIIIALDAADWRVLSPLIDAGSMPNLARVIESGSSGRLLAIDPVGSATAWATLLAGQGAHVHGVLSDMVATGDSEGVRPAVMADRAVPVVWEVAESTGITALAVGWGEPFQAADVHATLAGEGRSPLPDAIARMVASAPSEDADLAGLLAAGTRSGLTIMEHALASMADDGCGLACVRFPAFGALVANFVRFQAPCEPGVLPARAARYGVAVAEVCRLHDAWIGALIEQAGPGASVFVVSERGLDLGFWRHPPGTVTARPSAMVPPGIIAMRVPGGPRDAMAFGIRSNQVAGLVLDTLGVALPAAGAARPLGECGNLSHSNGRHASLAALRYSVFAAAAAACGDAAAARAAREAILASHPGDAATAAALADSLLDPRIPGGAARARQVLADCIAALGPAGEGRWIVALCEARMHLASGDHVSALDAVRRARAAGAPHAQATSLAARAAAAAGRLDEAAELCRGVLKDDPAQHDARTLLARVLFDLGTFAESESAAREALGVRWFDADTHTLLGAALAAQGRAAEALAALRVALEQDPAHAAALRRMAAVQLRQLGDIAASEATMREAGRVMRGQRPGGGDPGSR
jgi:tetratricopeptide (TPR) repeat protein